MQCSVVDTGIVPIPADMHWTSLMLATHQILTYLICDMFVVLAGNNIKGTIILG